MDSSNIRANHMDIQWQEHLASAGACPVLEAPFASRAALVGRVGLSLLACGTGAWRVRSAMNTIADVLGLRCSANIGLTSLDYSCFNHAESCTHSLALKNTGVNTSKLHRLEAFVGDFAQTAATHTLAEVHQMLDAIDHERGHYTPLLLGLAAAFACCAFTFLLGGGPVEMICAFLGAGAGNYLRCKLLARQFTLFLYVAVSVALACLVYSGILFLAETCFNISVAHEAGYVCAMLFIIPGFPFITSGIDMAKLDMRSGLERLAYALMIIGVASLTAWLLALLLHLQPENFPPFALSPLTQSFLRLIASFVGVFGFSMMFNSSPRMAASAASIGMVANTLRLELVDFTALPPAAAAFIGALVAGLLASLVNRRLGYPRIALTVPSIVIMVPGLYLYRGIYYFGVLALGDAAYWLTSAFLIIAALPLGLITARIISDPAFRHCN